MTGLRLFLSLILLSSLLAAAPVPALPTFTELDPGIAAYEVRWGDCNADGNLDLAVEGYSAGTRFVRVYLGNGAGGFTLDPNSNAMIGLTEGPVVWGDYDRDGDLDLAYAGWSGGGTGSRIYRNDGSAWSQVGTLRGMKGSDGAWFDYDNDGDLDLILTGESYDPPQGDYTIIYRNDGGNVFTPAVSLPGTYLGEVSVGDFDHDGDFDIALTGRTVGTQIFRNDGTGQFTPLGVSLPAMITCSIAWGDYDNDGDLDFILSGDGPAGAMIDLYRNNGDGTFTPLGPTLPVVRGGRIAWGDYDNDGWADLLLVGWNASNTSVAYVCRNNANGTFSDAGLGLLGVSTGACWGDFDNDGDLDIVLGGDPAGASFNPVVKVYRNESSTANTAPSIPAGTGATAFGNSLTFHWNASTDAQTPQPALTYNLRVGTTPGGQQIMTPMADPVTGKRRVAEAGNAQQNLHWTLRNLPAGTYYYSVQAIDNGYLASGWAAEQSITIAAPPTVSAMTPLPGSSTLSPPSSVAVTFSKAVDPATVTPATVRLLRAGPDGALGNGDDVPVVPTSMTLIGGNQAQLDLTGVRMPRGGYRVRVSGTAVSPPSPAASWALDEAGGAVAVDSAGLNDGSLVNSLLRIAGKLGGGVQLNGVDQSIDIPDHALLSTHAGPSGEMTVSAWVRLAALPGAGTRAPILVKGENTDWEYGLFVYPDGTVGFAMLQADGTLYGEARGGSFSTGTWHHVAGSVKKGLFVNVYLDGLPAENQLALSGATSDLAAPLRIGRSGPVPGPAEYLAGDVDDVRLFPSALSHVQVHGLATLGGAVRDLGGQILDGEFSSAFPSGNGSPGGDFVADFLVVPAQLQVTAMDPAPSGVLTSLPGDLTLTLNAALDASTVSPATVRLIRAGGDGNLGTGDDVVVTPSSITLPAPNQIRLSFSGVPLPNDQYRVTLSATTSAISGRVNYWALDDGAAFTAADSSGVAPGTLNGPLWRPGRIGNALRLNGKGDRVTIGAPALATPWTAAMWVLREDSPWVDARLMDPPTFSGGSLRLEAYNDTNRVGVGVYTVADYPSNYAAPVGQWVHLTFVGGVQTQLYVNGNLQDTIPASFAVPRYYMGSHGYNTMLGTLDDLQIFGRNLTAAEIRTLAALGGAVRDADGNRLDGEFGGTLPSGNNAEGGDFSATFTIGTPTAPGAFALGAPAAGAIGASTIPDFTWTSSAGATTYTLQVSTDPAFLALAINQSGIGGTSFTPGAALAPSTLYYWRVTAVNGMGTTPAGNAPASFTTGSASSPTVTNIVVRGGCGLLGLEVLILLALRRRVRNA